MGKLNLTWHQEAKAEEKEMDNAGAILSVASLKLNRTALSQLGDPQSVNIAYDANAKVIAIRNVSGEDDTIIAFDTTKRYNDESATIRSKEFMSKVINEMGLDLSGNKKLSCPANYNTRRKLLLIQVVSVEEVTE